MSAQVFHIPHARISQIDYRMGGPDGDEIHIQGVGLPDRRGRTEFAMRLDANALSRETIKALFGPEAQRVEYGLTFTEPEPLAGVPLDPWDAIREKVAADYAAALAAIDASIVAALDNVRAVPPAEPDPERLVGAYEGVPVYDDWGTDSWWE